MDIKENISLKSKNTLGVESIARYFVEVENVIDLQDAIAWAREKNIEILILGGGSNVCFVENEVKKLVIKVCIRGIEKGEGLVIVGAGEEWDSFVEKGIVYDIPNIENLSLIPGTVGAAPVQNIGAYGVEVKDMIEWVEVCDSNVGKVKKLITDECNFSYRDSIFKHQEGKGYVITRVAFKIKKDAPVSIEYKDLAEYFNENKAPSKEEVRKAVISIRAGKFPSLESSGTAGSFFKNPIITKKQFEEITTIYSSMPSYPAGEGKVKIPLAWVLDNVCGLRGYKDGNVWLHDKQPLVLVTNKKATAQDIKNFSEKIKQIVKEKINLDIEEEVRYVK